MTRRGIPVKTRIQALLWISAFAGMPGNSLIPQNY